MHSTQTQQSMDAKTKYTANQTYTKQTKSFESTLGKHYNRKHNSLWTLKQNTLQTKRTQNKQKVLSQRLVSITTGNIGPGPNFKINK